MVTMLDKKQNTPLGTPIPLHRIRNIGIIAHIDAGKTTLTERILYFTGHSYKMGEVDEGTTVMDFMDQERERGITINSAATTCYWKEACINIIDTPGHVDFTAEVERSLRVLDGGMVILDATSGVEPQSEMVWHQADKYHVPRICFVNKMDRVGASLDNTLTSIKERLKARAVSLQIPLGVEKDFWGVIDLIELRAWRFDKDLEIPPRELSIPPEWAEEASRRRKELIEAICEEDEKLLTCYLEREIEVEEIKAALRRVVIRGRIVPVLCGSALKNKGIHPLLDSIVDFLPAPSDIPPMQGYLPSSDREVKRSPRYDEPFCALVFKVVTDAFVGRLMYLRVYSGKVGVGETVLNSTRGKRERIGRLMRMHANRREEVEEAPCGDIVAVLGLRNTFTGDTLCDPHSPLVLENISFPSPLVSLSIEPKAKSDGASLDEALAKLAQEDPTFKVHYDEETGQSIIQGMGELHLEVLIERISREFGVTARVGKPRVFYHETVAGKADAEGRFIKQSGGRGQYGVVNLTVESQNLDSGVMFENHIKGGAIPLKFIPAIKEGVKEAADTGLHGYPLIGVKVALRDGSFHEVDSSEIAFKMAGSIAFREAVKKAGVKLLEPVMKMVLTTPEEYLGNIISDLQSRRADIQSIEQSHDLRILRSLIPLGETFGYINVLRSLSSGRATCFLEFHRYCEVPSFLTQEIISKRR